MALSVFLATLKLANGLAMMPELANDLALLELANGLAFMLELANGLAMMLELANNLALAHVTLLKIPAALAQSAGLALVPIVLASPVVLT